MRTSSTPFSFCILSILAVILVLLTGFLQPLHGQAAPTANATAHVIIQFAPGDTIVREIHFSTATITGLEALQLTGLPIGTQISSFGTMTCSINGVGDCVSKTEFWNYQNWSTGAWQDYLVGAGDATISDGAVEGWRWGEWGVGGLPPYLPVEAAASAFDWLQNQQDAATGGYAAPQEALLAIGSNRVKAESWQRASGDPTLTAFMMANANTIAKKGADSAGKLAAGLQAASGCWPVTASKPVSYYDAATGAYGAGAYGAGHQSWAILGEAALGETIPAKAVEYLKGLAMPDGGWEWDSGFGSDSNTSALAIQALISYGEVVGSPEIQNGLAYLRSVQNGDGGFYYQVMKTQPADSDTNSTAYAVMAISAVGQNPATWAKGSNDPFKYLLSQQHLDGSFQYQSAYPTSNIVATDQAITALLGKYYPLPGNRLAQCPAVYIPIISR